MIETFQIEPSSRAKRTPWKLSKFSNNFPEEYLGKKVQDEGGFSPIKVRWGKMKTMKGKSNGGSLLKDDFKIGEKQECDITEFFKFVSKTSSQMDSYIFDHKGGSVDDLDDLSLEEEAIRASLTLQWEFSLYYISQIKLFANMCQGRSYNCISHLSKNFPYPMLMHLVSNDKLEFEVRTAFCMLLKNLWVDRYPHSSNCGRPSVPNLVWVYNVLEKTDVDQEGALLHFNLDQGHPCLEMRETDADFEFLSMKSHTKFFLLRDFLVKFLASLEGVQTIGKKSKNDMVLIILRLAADLMSFGFFSTRSKIVQLCEPLLEVLDGRADITVELRSTLGFLKKELEKKRPKKTNASPSSPCHMVSEAGFEMTENPVLPAARKDQFHSRSENKQATCFGVDPDLITQHAGNMTIAGVDAFHLSTTGKCTPEYLNLLARRQIGKSRWSVDSDTLRIMNCKQNMLSVLRSVANLR